MYFLIKEHQEDMQPERRVNHIRKILKISCELKMNSQIGDNDMDYIIMDLGCEVNIRTRKT